jgi:nicotinate-nucleotide--dimethylbenzimidazole phosphoribosyltransferase
MSVEPLLEQRVALGEGLGAVMAVPVLQAASLLLAELPLAPAEAEEPAEPADPAETSEASETSESAQPADEADQDGAAV